MVKLLEFVGVSVVLDPGVPPGTVLLVAPPADPDSKPSVVLFENVGDSRP